MMKTTIQLDQAKREAAYQKVSGLLQKSLGLDKATFESYADEWIRFIFLRANSSDQTKKEGKNNRKEDPNDPGNRITRGRERGENAAETSENFLSGKTI